jgi:biopolymer transport protein ExbD
MAIRLDEKSAIDSVPMTPLIDCVFLLLIFFLVSTQLAEDERKLDVALPAASEAQPLVARPRELIVNIDEDGRYFVAGQQLSLAQLTERLQQAHVNHPTRASAILRADRRCRWQSVVSAINACVKARILDYRVTALADEA